MREVKRNNPAAAVRLDYDTVEVGAKSFVFSHEEGRVVERGRGQGRGSKVNSENVECNNVILLIGRFVQPLWIFEQTPGVEQF